MSGLTMPLDDYDSIIRETIWGEVVKDQYGRNSVLLSMAMGALLKPWNRGDSTTQPFAYAAAPAQNVGIGATWNYDDAPFLGSTRWGLRYTRSGLADYLERIAITYQDLGAKYNYLDLKCQHVLDGVALRQAIQLYKDGQAVAPTTGHPTGGTVEDRTLAMNGLDEGCNDGTVPGWQTKVFTTYLGATRSSYGSAQSSTPMYLNGLDGKPGPIHYRAMVERAMSLTRKGRGPSAVLTSQHGLTLMLAAIEERSRLAEWGTKPYWGPAGIKFLDGLIMVDELCPSARYGDKLTIPGESYATQHFALQAGMPQSSGLAAITVGTVIYIGEVAFFLSEQDWNYFMSTSSYFAMALSEFQKMWGSNMVAADVNCASTLMTEDPTRSGELLGFGDYYN